MSDVAGWGSQEGAIVSYGINRVSADIIAAFWPTFWKAAWLSDDMRTVTTDSPTMVDGLEYVTALAPG